MAKAPNLLYIQYDQQRYDCVSMSRRFGVKTPNLERIAGNGAFFENCYTPIPVCAPARQALFSGMRPESYGGLWNPHIVFPVCGMDKTMFSWTREVRDMGYNTAYIGCWEVETPLRLRLYLALLNTFRMAGYPAQSSGRSAFLIRSPAHGYRGAFKIR